MRSTIVYCAPPVALILAVVGCSIGQPAPAISPVDQAATIVAMTLSAAGVSTAAPVTTEAPSAPAPTPSATAKPELKINASGTACRRGPSPNAEIMATLDGGITVEMIARDSAEGYWMVKDPGSGSSCWVLMQDATASGSFSLLPEVTPQPTESKTTPAKPGSSAGFNYWEYDCGGGVVTLRWLDNADNETGYRVYRNGQSIAELPAGSTSYTDSIYLGIGPLQYSIRAYNDAGESAPLNTPGFSC